METMDESTTTAPATSAEVAPYSFSFSESALTVFTTNDQEIIKTAVNALASTDSKAMRLCGLTLEGDIFLAKTGKINAIHAERDQELIARIGYIDRRDAADGKNQFGFGIWSVVPGMCSEVFLPYWE